MVLKVPGEQPRVPGSLPNHEPQTNSSAQTYSFQKVSVL
jgi:hypothetical protein